MISIIIPTLQEESVLEQTLKNLKKLRTHEYEIIISDGKSTDKTVEIAKKYADKVVEHKENWRQNIAQGRNSGAAAARGDFFVFMDADGFIPNIDNFFSIALSNFEQDQKLVGMTVFLKVFPQMATIGDKLVFGFMNWMYFVSNNFLHVGGASGEFQMVRAKAFKQVNGFNEKFVASEDDEFFHRLGEIGHTKMESRLCLMHTSRRAHKIGWPKLLFLWTRNTLYNKLYQNTGIKEWPVIR